MPQDQPLRRPRVIGEEMHDWMLYYKSNKTGETELLYFYAKGVRVREKNTTAGVLRTAVQIDDVLMTVEGDVLAIR